MSEFIRAAFPLVTLGLAIAAAAASYIKGKLNGEKRRANDNRIPEGMCIGSCIGAVLGLTGLCSLAMGAGMGMLLGMGAGMCYIK